MHAHGVVHEIAVSDRAWLREPTWHLTSDRLPRPRQNIHAPSEEVVWIPLESSPLPDEGDRPRVACHVLSVEHEHSGDHPQLPHKARTLLVLRL